MRKRYSSDFKVRVVMEVLKEEKTVSQVASEYDVHPNQISNWKTLLISGLPSVFEKDSSKASISKADYEKQINELYTEIGKLTTQLAWVKKKAGIEP
jgi:transposase-like protein